MAHYEIEIKSLLGEAARAEEFRGRLLAFNPAAVKTGGSRQLNHYFEDGDPAALFAAASSVLTKDAAAKLESLMDKGRDFSVRTRQKDDEVMLVLKAAVDGGTSTNAVVRLEFEEPVSASLHALDELVLSAGFRYQAKWSREREEYVCNGTTVCLDKNAGYGYLAEFERIAKRAEEAESERQALLSLMASLGAAELPQERLARMFAHYNQNWQEYYGTDKIFVIE
jgi:adenylate cyclase class IV